MENNKAINKLIGIYQIVGGIWGLFTMLKNQFNFASIVFLIFILFTFIASIMLIMRENKTLFIVAQLMQILSMSVPGLVYYFQAGLHFGPSFGTVNGETSFEFYFHFPRYLMLFIENRNELMFSINLIPCAILLYFYYTSKKQKESDIIY